MGRFGSHPRCLYTGHEMRTLSFCSGYVQYTRTHTFSLSLSLSLSHTCTYVPRAVAFNNARDDSDLSGGHPQTRADRPDGGVGRGHVGEGAEVQIDHCTELSK